VTFLNVGGMVLKTKRPTLAKDALGWGTLKFRYPPAHLLDEQSTAVEPEFAIEPQAKQPRSPENERIA
jgi:hypothetical protein